MPNETVPTQSLAEEAVTECAGRGDGDCLRAAEPISQKQARLEHKARYWLRKGYRSVERIEELREFIGKRRGPATVERLVEEMRDQWRRRQEWLHEGDD
ncbi:hypothetical protein ACE0DR_27240 [Azotobacter sp. CWF10]